MTREKYGLFPILRSELGRIGRWAASARDRLLIYFVAFWIGFMLGFILLGPKADYGFDNLDGIGNGRPLIIESSGGGNVFAFRLKGEELLHSHTQIIVDGPCLSACGLLVDVARDNVCITTNAVIGYHKAALYVDNKPTLIFPLWYETPGLNEYLASRGGEPDPPDIMLVDFKDLKQFYRPCKSAA